MTDRDLAPSGTARFTRDEVPHLEIWDVLHRHCGASAVMSPAFPFHWPKCVEYRFMGALGFGGKIWNNAGRWYVTCYGEHQTKERLGMIQRANLCLAALKAKSSSERSDERAAPNPESSPLKEKP